MIILILFASCFFNNDEVSFVRHVNKTLNLSIPLKNANYYNDSTGGFHGDGNIVEIICLNKKENVIFNETIDKKWLYLDQESDIYNCLWCSETKPGEKPWGGLLDDKFIPEKDLRFILYDDFNLKTNNDINLKEMFDFYYVGYSFEESKIYIQRSTI